MISIANRNDATELQVERGRVRARAAPRARAGNQWQSLSVWPKGPAAAHRNLNLLPVDYARYPGPLASRHGY